MSIAAFIVVWILVSVALIIISDYKKGMCICLH